jgi:hypothetical protein
MSKKEKAAVGLAKDFQAMIALVPKLSAFIKVHEEIAAGYQKYRNSGGVAIPGVEKHLGIKQEKSTPVEKKKAAATTAAVKAPKKVAAVSKDKKKVKK